MAELLVICICLILNALFASYEMAFVSVSKAELKKLARDPFRRRQSKDAQMVLAWRDRPERTLSIIQIGITLVGAVSAAVGGAGSSESIEPFLISELHWKQNTAEVISIALVVIPLTFVNVLMGELVPKSLALKNSIRISLFGARWISWIERIFSPAVNMFEWATRHVLRIFFPRANSEKASEKTEESWIDPPQKN